MQKIEFCFLVLMASIILSGCASNPYSKYYTDYMDGADVLADNRFVHSLTPPKIQQGEDVQKDADDMHRLNYLPLGMSKFNSAEISENKALDQASEVHADIVLTYCAYQETLSGNMPLSLPDVQTSSTYLSGNVYGSGGRSASYSGNAHTTTHGTQTTYIPYNVRRYDYIATFWKQRKKHFIGVFLDDLSSESKALTESNQGAEVRIVMQDSPAFYGDILEGDIILKVNGKKFSSVPHAQEVISLSAGRKISFTIFRNGKIIEKDILLRERFRP